MRTAWDASEGAAREAVLAAGAQVNAANIPAFRAAAEPLLRDYLRSPELSALHRLIRDLA
jgi:TRAP-type C4-dicarboxylate transport system substrate-binding protein